MAEATAQVEFYFYSDNNENGKVGVVGVSSDRFLIDTLKFLPEELILINLKCEPYLKIYFARFLPSERAVGIPEFKSRKSYLEKEILHNYIHRHVRSTMQFPMVEQTLASLAKIPTLQNIRDLSWELRPEVPDSAPFRYESACQP